MKQVWWHNNGKPAQAEPSSGIIELIRKLESPYFIVKNNAEPFLNAEGEITVTPATALCPVSEFYPAFPPVSSVILFFRKYTARLIAIWAGPWPRGFRLWR
jgi:hypothetical protein